MQKVARIFRWAPAAIVAGLVTSSFEKTSSALDNVPPKTSAEVQDAHKTGFMPYFITGGSVRLDDAPIFNLKERVGGNFGLGFLYQLKAISFGLSYEYASLGREDSGIGPYGFVQINRSIDSVLASARFNFSGLSWAMPYVGVGVGGSWQDATMRGVVLFDGGISGGTPFSCTASDSASIALRLGTGMAVPLSTNVSFLTDIAFDNYRLSSDIIQSCAPGAGTTATFMARVGLAYRFEMSESPKPKVRSAP